MCKGLKRKRALPNDEKGSSITQERLLAKRTIDSLGITPKRSNELNGNEELAGLAGNNIKLTHHQ